MDNEELISKIIQCAYNVRTHLCQGYLEAVYRKALIIELRENGLSAEEETPINVYYKESIVGIFRADIIVEGKVIIELKAVQELNKAHETQLVNYLVATKMDYGILVNYGGDKIAIKRKYRIYNKA